MRIAIVAGGLFGALPLLALSSSARAQEAVEETAPETSQETPAAPDAARPRAIQEVVVTAQKREEAIQDVPISIQAFSGSQLDARGIDNVRDLGLITPSLQFTDLAGYTLIYLRGVGTDAFIPSAEPSIATYVDGVYFPSAHSLVSSFGALKRIEILKGPQGTLFGRNSTGGAINLITEAPGPTSQVSLRAGYGSYNDYKARAYVNVPVTDHFAASVSGVFHHADSYYTLDNPAGDALAHETSQGARVKLRYFPSETFDVTVTGIGYTQDGPGSALSVTTHPSPLASLLGVPAEQRQYVATDDSAPDIRTTTRALYQETDWRPAWLDVKLLASYYATSTGDFTYDFDGSSQPLVTFTTYQDFQKIKTAELQFISKEGGIGPDWLKFVGGLYYLRSNGGYNPVFLSIARSAVTLPTGQIVDLVPQRLLDLLPPIPTPENVGLYFLGLIDTKSYSGYTQATADLTDWFDVTAGVRVQRETRALTKSDVNLDNSSGGQTSVIRFSPRSSTLTNVSPKLSLDFKPLEGLLLFATVQQGFKSATYNIVNIYTPPDYVKPEKVTAYELGAKSTLLNGALQLNGAVFDNQITNLQTAFVSLLSGGAVNFSNAGAAHIRGAEFDADWLLLPALDPGLALTAGASYLDAIYTSFKNGSGFDQTTGLYFPNGDFSGNRIVRTPKFTGTLSLGQTLNTGLGPVEIAGDYSYNSGYYYLPQNSPISREPSYAVVNAHASYLYPKLGARLTVFCRNLTDERYNIQQFHSDFGRADTLAAPRTVGLWLDWDF